MAQDLDKIKLEGIVFKRGKDESVERKSSSRNIPRKPKGKTISGASKMKAAYKTRKAIRSKPKK